MHWKRDTRYKGNTDSMVERNNQKVGTDKVPLPAWLD